MSAEKPVAAEPTPVRLTAERARLDRLSPSGD